MYHGIHIRRSKVLLFPAVGVIVSPKIVLRAVVQTIVITAMTFTTCQKLCAVIIRHADPARMSIQPALRQPIRYATRARPTITSRGANATRNGRVLTRNRTDPRRQIVFATRLGTARGANGMKGIAINVTKESGTTREQKHLRRRTEVEIARAMLREKLTVTQVLHAPIGIQRVIKTNSVVVIIETIASKTGVNNTALSTAAVVETGETVVVGNFKGNVQKLDTN